MEVKIVFNNMRIESHAIPDPVGKTRSWTADLDDEYEDKENLGKDLTVNELDATIDIVDSIELRKGEGLFLERRVVLPGKRLADDNNTFYRNSSKDYCILPLSQLGLVKAVYVDGEQFYPELNEDDEPTFEELKELAAVLR